MENEMTDQISRRVAIGAGALLGAAAIATTRVQAQTAQPAAGDTLAKVKATGTLLAGVRNDFPPIGSIDTSGKPVGFGPDLADAFAKKLGVKAEFVPTTSRTRIPLLQNGSIDCEFGITTPTVEREKTVDFSIPYVWDAVSIIIKEGASKSVKDYAPPKKVATTQGSYIIELFKQHIANPEIVLFQEYPDAVQALRNGKVDGVGVNRASSVAYVRKGSGLEMSEDMVRDPWGIMVRPNDSNWRNWLNHTLQELWRDGTYKTLWEKHMGEAPDFYMFSPYMLQPGVK
jgi:polar amino acid transport system substrate-binding protein